MGKPKRRKAVAVRDGSALCLSCGMCCDGSLFSNGLLVDDEEVGLARSLGLEILGGPEAGTSWKFRQPCACFQAGECAVYDQEKPGV